MRSQYGKRNVVFLDDAIITQNSDQPEQGDQIDQTVAARMFGIEFVSHSMPIPF